jgi:hypothetical protein
VRYLIDEQVLSLVRQLRRHMPDLFVVGVGDPGAPARGTDDRGVLAWCEQHDSVLVTDDRRTMRRHFDDHLASGRHSPGVLVLHPGMTTGEALELLSLAVAVVDPERLRDRYLFLRYV